MEWLVYFIIIGIISSIFNKNKRPNQQTPNRPERNQPQGNSPNGRQRDWEAEFEDFDVFEDFKDLPKKVEEAFPRKDKFDDFNNKSRESIYNSEIEDRTQLTSIDESKIYNEIKQPKKARTKLNTGNEDLYTSSFIEKTVDREQVIQGMIWSEIFGKPRSKNPYYVYGKRNR